MSKYAELPWSVEDTIENLKELKDSMKERVILLNLHGRGEKDAEEIEFDFGRAIEALNKQIPKKPTKTEDEGCRYTDTYRCPTCGGNFSGTGIADYCYHCGQAIDWSDDHEK